MATEPDWLANPFGLLVSTWTSQTRPSSLVGDLWWVVVTCYPSPYQSRNRFDPLKNSDQLVNRSAHELAQFKTRTAGQLQKTKKTF